MRTAAGRRFIRVLVLSGIIGFASSCQGGPETGQTNAAAVTTADKAGDTAKDVVAEGKAAMRQGVEKADKAVTNVVHEIGVGVYKATAVATNAEAKVKVAVTNAVGEIKEAFKDATR